MVAKRSYTVQTVAMILAGGEGSRLSVLSGKRAKPAVPFGGIYRIIDFTMSNVMHSEIPVVGICTQYKPYSLMDHLSIGEGWGFARRGYLAKVLPPYTGEVDSDWYAGTADAIYQNLEFIARFKPKRVLILSGDHIYRMDYRPMIALHIERKAALTIACQEVPWDEVSRFGIMETDSDGRIVRFYEKPQGPVASNLANLGIYVFDAEVLAERLRADARSPNSTHDFGRDIIPGMIESFPCHAYTFSGYWRDVGTYKSYWQAHMDLLDPRSGLDIHHWGVCTSTRGAFDYYLSPARFLGAGAAEQSIVSFGCQIEGRVCRSVLSPGVHVAAGARIENSVLLNGVQVGRDCFIRNAIIDKNCVIGERCSIGGDPENKTASNNSAVVTLIGKQATLPPDYIAAAGCIIPYGAGPTTLPASPLLPGTPIPPS